MRTIPPHIGLVIDNSGSMRNKRADVMAAAQACARASNPSNELFIVNFNEKVWPGLPADVPFTSDIGMLTRALSRVSASGLTALYDAIDRALDHLSLGANSRRVLVVVSDGGDNASTARLERVLDRARGSEVVIYTMGLFDEYTDERNPGVLRQLASATGGESFLPDDVQQASQTLDRIAQDIRNVYTLGYVPTNANRDGRYRKIRVTLSGERQGEPLRVRAREGYVAPRDGGP